MSLSQAWARIRAFFTFSQSKGDSNLLTSDVAGAPALTDLVADAATAAVAVSVAGTDTAAAALSSAVAVPVSTGGAQFFLPGNLVATAAPGAVDSGSAASLDADDEGATGDELESLKAISGGGLDLFVTVLKDLVSFALDLGHDFDAAYDKSVSRAKTLTAKL